VAIFDPCKLLPGRHVYCRFNYTAALRTFDILVRCEASDVYDVELKYVNSHNSFHDSQYLDSIRWNGDRFCGLVVRVLDYRCRGPGFDSQALQKKKEWVWNVVHSVS
jgi:hypothetical protein